MKRWSLGFNPLGFLASIAMAVAMFFPFWAFRLVYMETTNVYPYIISGPIADYIGYNRNRLMPVLTGVLIACIIFCLVGSLLKARPGRILLAVSGVLAFLCVWRFLARIKGLADYFHLPVQGHGIASAGAFAKVPAWTWIQPGLYLIVIGAVLAIIASLLHERIQLDH
jgi:hypothetical protein